MIRKLIRILRRVIAELTLEQFEKRTEWPLATVAVIFLAAYHRAISTASSTIVVRIWLATRQPTIIRE